MAGTDRWVLADLVKDPANPVFVVPPDDAATHAITDVCFISVLRVDHLLDAPLDGHRFSAWLWSHGLDPRTEHNGGRLRLVTAADLTGPWTDRGHVTGNGVAPTGWWQTSLTGGDVVWSVRHRRFFTVPHSSRCMRGEIDKGEQGCAAPDDPAFVPSADDGRCRLDSLLLESADGVTWELSDVPQPVLPPGPDEWDDHETGYGRLLPDPVLGEDRWLWLYRGQRRFGHYALGVAEAPDVRGPWRKVAGPVFEPTGGALFCIGGLTHTDGAYQLLWMGPGGDTYLARSADLVTWEEHPGGPVLRAGAGPHEAYGTHGSFVRDVDGSLCYLYASSDEQNFAAWQGHGRPGGVSLCLARPASPA